MKGKIHDSPPRTRLPALGPPGALVQLPVLLAPGPQWHRDPLRPPEAVLERPLPADAGVAQVHPEADARRPAVDLGRRGGGVPPLARPAGQGEPRPRAILALRRGDGLARRRRALPRAPVRLAPVGPACADLLARLPGGVAELHHVRHLPPARAAR